VVDLEIVRLLEKQDNGNELNFGVVCDTDHGEGLQILGKDSELQIPRSGGSRAGPACVRTQITAPVKMFKKRLSMTILGLFMTFC